MTTEPLTGTTKRLVIDAQGLTDYTDQGTVSTFFRGSTSIHLIRLNWGGEVVIDAKVRIP